MRHTSRFTTLSNLLGALLTAAQQYNIREHAITHSVINMFVRHHWNIEELSICIWIEIICFKIYDKYKVNSMHTKKVLNYFFRQEFILLYSGLKLSSNNTCIFMQNDYHWKTYWFCISQSSCPVFLSVQYERPYILAARECPRSDRTRSPGNLSGRSLPGNRNRICILTLASSIISFCSRGAENHYMELVFSL